MIWFQDDMSDTLYQNCNFTSFKQYEQMVEHICMIHSHKRVLCLQLPVWPVRVCDIAANVCNALRLWTLFYIFYGHLNCIFQHDITIYQLCRNELSKKC